MNNNSFIILFPIALICAGDGLPAVDLIYAGIKDNKIAGISVFNNPFIFLFIILFIR